MVEGGGAEDVEANGDDNMIERELGLYQSDCVGCTDGSAQHEGEEDGAGGQPPSR